MQTQITDFTEEWNQAQIMEEVNKKLELTAEMHMRKFVRYYLKSRKSPPSLEAFLAYTGKALHKIEKRGFFKYRKRLMTTTYLE